MYPAPLSQYDVARPRSGDVALVQGSDLFDSDWYGSNHADVAASGLTPAEHYLWFGALLRRDPSPRFSTAFYLRDNADVARSGMNPLVHYLRFGRGEGRRATAVDVLETAAGPGQLAQTVGPNPWLDDLRQSTLLDALPKPHEALADQISGTVLACADRILAQAPDPRVSVVIPSWNRATVVGRALKSALDQSLPPMEILLVDDGSTDNTVARLQADYAEAIADGRLKLIESAHLGVSGARNAGLAAARGDLIAYLDSDNAWRPDYLKLMCAFFAECDDAMTAYAGLAMRDEDRGESDLRGRPFDRRRLVGNNFIDLNVYMHRRAIYDQLGGFDQTLKRLVDWDMILRHTKRYQPAYLPFVAVDYYLDKKTLGNITRTVDLDANKAAVMAKLRTERFRRGLEKPRIGYVLWDWPALSQTFVLGELKWLVENGFDVEVFYHTRPDRAAELTFPIAAFEVRDDTHLAQMLIERGRTLVHSHFAYPATTRLTWPACQAAGVPFTFFAHAVDIFLETNIARNRIEEVVCDPLCLKLFVHGDYHRNFLAKQDVPPEKIAYNFQAVDLDLFRAVPEKAAQPPGHRMRGVFVGRFVEKKGLETLIEAAGLLEAANVAFDIYGYGPLEADIRAKAKALGLDNVVFHGPLDGRDQVRAVLEAADFCIVPSIVATTGDTEGFPTIILEAMAAHRPVVTTTVSSIPDFLDDGITAFLAEPRDPQSLADAVRRLLALDPPRRSAVLRDAVSFLDRRVGLARTMQCYLDTWFENEIDIVLVTYNTPDYDDRAETLEVIERIRRHTTTPYTLTVIDNGSDPDFRETLQALACKMPQMRYLPLQTNRYVGPATNLALAASDAVFTIYLCSKEGFVAHHGWERPLIDHMRQNPGQTLAGTLCHMPPFTLGEEIATHPKFADFRNGDFARRVPKRPFQHVQGGLFILRRRDVARFGGFSDALPQGHTDVEFSYHLESQGAELAILPEISALTVKTLPPLSAVIDERTAAAHPLTCETAGQLDRMRLRHTTRCNLCDTWDCIGEDGICTSCGSTGLARKQYQALAHTWRAHRGAAALMVDGSGALAARLGERMFRVTMARGDDLPTAGRFMLICLGRCPDPAEVPRLTGLLAPGGLMLWPEGSDGSPETLAAAAESASDITVSHRMSRVLRSDWRRLYMLRQED